jgi:hypothetical protein
LFVDVVRSCECDPFLIIGSMMPPVLMSSFSSDPLLTNTDMNEGNAPGTRGVVCIGMLGDREKEMDLRLIGEEMD